MDQEQKQKILDFMRRQPLMTISTIHTDGRPQSAVVGFAEKESLEIIFGTSNTTRKYQNIANNPNVACVIGWDPKEPITVQYEGMARELSDEEAQTEGEILIKKNPFAARFRGDPLHRYFTVTPRWIRYFDLKNGKIFEIQL